MPGLLILGHGNIESAFLDSLSKSFDIISFLWGPISNAFVWTSFNNLIKTSAFANTTAKTFLIVGSNPIPLFLSFIISFILTSMNVSIFCFSLLKLLCKSNMSFFNDWSFTTTIFCSPVALSLTTLAYFPTSPTLFIMSNFNFF